MKNAVVVDIDRVHGLPNLVKLRLWTGEIVTAHSVQLQLDQPFSWIKIGDEYEVVLKEVKYVTAAKRITPPHQESVTV